MKLRTYVLLIFCICALVFMGYAVGITYKRVQTRLTENKVLKWQMEALENESAKMAGYKTQLDTLSAEISSLRQELDSKQDKADRGGERPCYELSAAERDLVERVAMAEAEDEPYTGKMLVCQCILNACRLNNKRPAAIIKQYAYAKRRPNPSKSVKEAVAAVFDRGETVTDEQIIYFYAPALVESAFHERQRFIVEVGGHRFFAEG
jgi:spore germination cell wall hydrolase CwlJ-like protein